MSRRDAASWAAGIGALCAGFWLLRIALSAFSGASLHVDEAQYWDWSRHLQWGYYSKPPMIAALIRASSALFGNDETGLRALAMACYPLAAAALAWLAADIARDGPAPSGGAARWAAGLLLASPLVCLLGVVATTDGPLVLCWSLGTASLWFAVVRQRAGAWVVFALACGAGMLSKYTFGAFIAGAALFVVLHGTRRDWLRGLAAAVGALLLWSPNLWWNHSQGWPTLRHTAEITVQAERHARSASAAVSATTEFLAGQLVAFGPVALLVLAFILWRRRGEPAALPRKARALLLWTSAPLALAGLLQSWRSGAQVNWIAPVHLAFFLAAALAVAAAAHRPRRWMAAALGLQVALLSALTVLPSLSAAFGRPVPHALDLWGRMRGWGEALHLMEPSLAAAPDAIVVGTSRAALTQAAYHWRGLGVKRAAWQPGTVPRDQYQLRCPWSLKDGGPIFVLSEGAPPEDIAQAVGGLQTVSIARVQVTARRTIDLRLSRPAQPLPRAAGERKVCE
jgi:4-amino-4-deoxy-L-arabinose transferase-like glycosyltransferase